MLTLKKDDCAIRYYRVAQSLFIAISRSCYCKVIFGMCCYFMVISVVAVSISLSLFMSVNVQLLMVIP